MNAFHYIGFALIATGTWIIAVKDDWYTVAVLLGMTGVAFVYLGGPIA